jgi:hypothetical protein
MLRFPKVAIINIDRSLAAPERWLRKELPDLTYAYETPDFDSQGRPRDPGDVWSAALSAMDEACQSKDIDWVGFDGLTSANFYLIAHVLKKYGKTEMEQNLWIPFRANLIRLLNTAKASGKNFIMTCHEETETDRAGTPTRRKPLVDSKLKECIGGWFADVWRCTSGPGPGGTVKFYVDTRPTAIDELKCSFPSMKPQVIIDVTRPDQFNFKRDVLPHLQ